MSRKECILRDLMCRLSNLYRNHVMKGACSFNNYYKGLRVKLIALVQLDMFALDIPIIKQKINHKVMTRPI